MRFQSRANTAQHSSRKGTRVTLDDEERNVHQRRIISDRFLFARFPRNKKDHLVISGKNPNATRSLASKPGSFRKPRFPRPKACHALSRFQTQKERERERERRKKEGGKWEELFPCRGKTGWKTERTGGEFRQRCLSVGRSISLVSKLIGVSFFLSSFFFFLLSKCENLEQSRYSFAS